MANPSELIKTVTDLPWSGLAKLVIFIIVAGLFSMEWLEDKESDTQSAQEDGEYVLLRDLAVSQSVALEALRASIQGQEVRQDIKIDELKECH